MDIIEFVEFIKYAKDKDNDDRIFKEWCAKLPMLKREYWDYSYYKDCVTGAGIDTRPTPVIIAEIEAMHRSAGM